MSKRKRIIKQSTVTKPGLYVATKNFKMKVFTDAQDGKFNRWLVEREVVFFIERVDSWSVKVLTQTGVGFISYHVAQDWMTKA